MSPLQRLSFCQQEFPAGSHSSRDLLSPLLPPSSSSSSVVLKKKKKKIQQNLFLSSKTKQDLLLHEVFKQPGQLGHTVLHEPKLREEAAKKKN